MKTVPLDPYKATAIAAGWRFFEGAMPRTLVVASILAAISPAACFLPATNGLVPFPCRHWGKGSVLSLCANLPGGTGGMQGAIVTKAGSACVCAGMRAGTLRVCMVSLRLPLCVFAQASAARSVRAIGPGVAP